MMQAALDIILAKDCSITYMLTSSLDINFFNITKLD